MIAIIDYGLGNVAAFETIYRHLGYSVVAASTSESLSGADKIVLPGVGAFDWAMAKLNSSGLRAELEEAVLQRGVDVLGVCVGMQMLARSSEEGHEPGLGWVKAKVRRLRAQINNTSYDLPHMGWNDVAPTPSGEALFKDIADPQYYFLHSYYIEVSDAEDAASTSSYGEEFVSSVAVGNIYGTQFHPEKSHAWGVRLLQNFALLR